MPEVQKFHDKYAGRDDFEFITVATDDHGTMPGLRKLLRDKDVQFPVLHYYEGERGGTFDWHVAFVPTAYLIDPQGSIVGDFEINKEFESLLDQFLAMDDPYLPYGVEISQSKNDDGSYRIAVKGTSPNHEPLSGSFTVDLGIREYVERIDVEWQVVDPIPDGKKLNSVGYHKLDGFDQLAFNLEFDEFDEFGESTIYFDLPVGDLKNLRNFYCTAELTLPEIDSLNIDSPLVISNLLGIKVEKRKAR